MYFYRSIVVKKILYFQMLYVTIKMVREDHSPLGSSIYDPGSVPLAGFEGDDHLMTSGGREPLFVTGEISSCVPTVPKICKRKAERL